MIRQYLVIMSCCLHFSVALAQKNQSFIVTDSATGEKLEGVVIVLKNEMLSAVTDSNGKAEIGGIKTGPEIIEASYIGYQKFSANLNFSLAEKATIAIKLQQQQSEIEEVTITSTRTNSRIEDAPIKIEVLGAEELNEEGSLKPGNIASLLGDVSGVQIQQTSALSGNSIVRMQGLDGRYTLMLRDGMPVYSGVSGGLSVLQIPPLDLRQVELIKGPASTINGGGAISGLINFITKEPGDSTEALLLLNQSSLLETNLNFYTAGKKNNMGFTFFAAGTHQAPVDVNGDGFSDVPKTISVLLHPQLFFNPDKSTRIRVGLNGNYENRTGGDMKVISGQADSTHQYFEKSILQNYSADFSIGHEFSKAQGIYFKASANYFDRDFSTNYAEVKGAQWLGYSELFYQYNRKRNTLIAGGNYLLDLFRRSAGDTSGFPDYNWHTGGLFIQYTYNVENKLNFQAGLRGDYQSKYGIFVLPSAAILVHANREFSIRINGGSGYKVPNILEILALEEGINAPPVNLNLMAEHSYGGTLEWNYRKLFDKLRMSVFINQTFFSTWVQHAINTSQDSSGNYSVVNLTNGALTMGVDNYIRIKKDPVELYVGYTFTYPRKNSDANQPWLTLTPLHRLAAVFSWDITKYLKWGIEGSLMGKQYLDYGSPSKPYFLMSSSLQYHVKRITLVLNGENLLNVRQSHYGPVVWGAEAHPQFAPVWAPVDGVVINLSLMVRIL